MLSFLYKEATPSGTTKETRPFQCENKPPSLPTNQTFLFLKEETLSASREETRPFGLRALTRLSCPPQVIRALSSTISHLPVSDGCEINLTRPGDQLCDENYTSQRSAYFPFLGNTPRKHTQRRSPGRERTTWDPGRTVGARREDTSTSHLNG